MSNYPKSKEAANSNLFKSIIAGVLIICLCILLTYLTLQHRATSCRLTKLENEILVFKEKLVNFENESVENISRHRMKRETVNIAQRFQDGKLEECCKLLKISCDVVYTKDLPLLGKTGLEIGKLPENRTLEGQIPATGAEEGPVPGARGVRRLLPRAGYSKPLLPGARRLLPTARAMKVSGPGDKAVAFGQPPTPILDDNSIARRQQRLSAVGESSTPLNNTESGAYFYPNTHDPNYMLFENKFQLAQRFKITMKIKPKSPSGVILAVAGNQDDGMTLQLINGTIKAIVHVGGSTFSCTFVKQPNELCDGEWHTVQVNKSRNVLTLAVDDVFALPSIGQTIGFWKDSRNPLYFGGLPTSLLPSMIGLETNESFLGCVKDLHLEGTESTLMNLGVGRVVGNINTQSCPIDP